MNTYPGPLSHFLTHLSDVTKLRVSSADKGTHAGAANHVHGNTYQGGEVREGNHHMGQKQTSDRA